MIHCSHWIHTSLITITNARTPSSGLERSKNWEMTDTHTRTIADHHNTRLDERIARVESEKHF